MLIGGESCNNKNVEDLQIRLRCIFLSGAMLSNTLGSSINVKMKTDSFSRP